VAATAGEIPGTPGRNTATIMNAEPGKVKQRGRGASSGGPGGAPIRPAGGQVRMSATSQSSPTFSIVIVTQFL
jgi:hypothetical protein